MRHIKKLLAVAMVVVMALSALTFSVGAESIADTAKKISSGSKVSDTMYKGESLVYAVNVNQKGILKINFTAKFEYMEVYVYDKNGNRIDESDVKYITGGDWTIYDIGESFIDFKWNEKFEKIEADLQYTVEKGIYYIEFCRVSSSDGSGKLDFTATFPSTSTSTVSKGKIHYFRITMEKGDTLKFGAMVSSGTKVTWSSSNPSVATMSNGMITAKAKGSTIITAKSGTSSQKIKIVVT